MNKGKLIDTQYGKMSIEIGTYDNGRIAVQLVKKNGEVFGDLTINLPYERPKTDEVFINAWNDRELLDHFKEAGIIKKYCGKVQYNMGRYEKVKLNLKKLMEYDDLGYNQHLGKYKPFMVFDTGKLVAIVLDQYDYNYDWVEEDVSYDPEFGDGHCYKDLFEDYLKDNYAELNKKLKYDSENGMFCVKCKTREDADKVATILSNLYKDEDKMIELIKQTKINHDYEFNIKM